MAIVIITIWKLFLGNFGYSRKYLLTCGWSNISHHTPSSEQGNKVNSEHICIIIYKVNGQGNLYQSIAMHADQWVCQTISKSYSKAKCINMW